MEGEPIPVMFIPRKPHPNGLLVYLAATPVQLGDRRVPFITDVMPHVRVLHINPTIALETLVMR